MYIHIYICSNVQLLSTLEGEKAIKTLIYLYM